MPDGVLDGLAIFRIKDIMASYLKTLGENILFEDWLAAEWLSSSETAPFASIS
jgi:hypothetical protein